jgi:hypothetical protein
MLEEGTQNLGLCHLERSREVIAVLDCARTDNS